MTKILYVSGDDYAALTFDRLAENGLLSAGELWATGGGEYTDDDENYFEYKALEFGDVDPKFIEWVLSIQDYDESKHSGFYVVED